MSGALGMGQAQGGSGGEGGGDAAPDPGPMGQQLQAHFGKTSEALKAVDNVRTGLGKLATMGSAVTPEDVIKEAGVLVGKGADPMSLAGLMADMPTNGGDALAAWVAMHAQQAQQNEQQLKQVHTVVRHSMGVHAIHQLARNAVTPPQAGQQGAGGLGQMPMQGNA